MPSSEVNSLEGQPVADEQKSQPRMVADTFEIWNRKFHYYVGLYFLLFIWLFSFSGLMLNHHWQIATSWYPNRKQWSVKKPIQLPDGTNLEKARNLMRQLDISGEVSLGEAQSKPGQFDFRAVKPGRFFQIHADPVTNQASVQIAQANAWGIMHMLHTFSGVRREDPCQQRNWIVTKIWTFSMDALALGLIFLVLSSYYMWYGFKRNGAFGAGLRFRPHTCSAGSLWSASSGSFHSSTSLWSCTLVARSRSVTAESSACRGTGFFDAIH